MKKNILVIMRSAPYGQSRARDAIDLILTSAAYDQEISVLFQSDGIFQLIAEQQPKELGLKNINAQISAFEMYDIEAVYYDQESLSARGLKPEQLNDQIKPVSNSEIQSLLNQADTVLTF